MFVIERTGGVKLVDLATGKVETIAQLTVELRKDEFARECGLLGITFDPVFEKNHWLYLYYSPVGKSAHQLSRFTFTGTSLKDEKPLLQVAQDPENSTYHEGGYPS